MSIDDLCKINTTPLTLRSAPLLTSSRPSQAIFLLVRIEYANKKKLSKSAKEVFVATFSPYDSCFLSCSITMPYLLFPRFTPYLLFPRFTPRCSY